MHTTQLAFLALALSFNYVQADLDVAVQSSLYVPGFTFASHFSADVLGVGPNQETTYELYGLSSGPLATLVEGPSDAVIAYQIGTVSAVISCDIASDTALCSGGFPNGQAITTFTEIPSPVPIDLGISTQTSSSSLTTSVGPSNSQRTAAASQTGTASDAASSSSEPSGTAKPNGSKRIALSSLAAIVGIGGMVFAVV